MTSAIRDNTAQSRFELDADGGTAVAYYHREDGVLTFTHTETPVHLQGRGIASRLVRGALEQARSKRVKVRPRCGFVSQYIARHPEFLDLLA